MLVQAAQTQKKSPETSLLSNLMSNLPKRTSTPRKGQDDEREELNSEAKTKSKGWDVMMIVWFLSSSQLSNYTQQKKMCSFCPVNGILNSFNKVVCCEFQRSLLIDWIFMCQNARAKFFHYLFFFSHWSNSACLLRPLRAGTKPNENCFCVLGDLWLNDTVADTDFTPLFLDLSVSVKLSYIIKFEVNSGFLVGALTETWFCQNFCKNPVTDPGFPRGAPPPEGASTYIWPILDRGARPSPPPFLNPLMKPYQIVIFFIQAWSISTWSPLTQFVKF